MKKGGGFGFDASSKQNLPRVIPPIHWDGRELCQKGNVYL